MKYILLFCGTRDGAGPASSPEDVQRIYASVGGWLTRNSSKIGSIHQLQPPDTATTVLLQGQRRPAGGRDQAGRPARPAGPAGPAVTEAGEAGPGPEAARATASSAQAHAAVAAAFRAEAGHLTASLVRSLRDFDLAEESIQEAVVQALEHWPREGIPSRPGAWLLTVARRRALNQLNRDARYAAKLAELVREPAPEPAPEPGDRLQLVFTCCHPALRREWQVALTLRAVFGFTTAEIARAFVASEDAVAQRIVRAKRKIASAGIPYRMPGPQELPGRLPEVLAVLYLLFNEGHLATSGSGWRRDLSQDALWLTGLLCRLLPGEPEALGLLALMRLHLARADARFTDTGDLVRLADQDRSLWDHDAIQEAVTLIERAALASRQAQPRPRDLAGGRCAGGLARAGPAGHGTRRLPHLPRGPRRAALGDGPRRAGTGRAAAGPRPDPQPGRTGAPAPAAPALTTLPGKGRKHRAGGSVPQDRSGPHESGHLLRCRPFFATAWRGDPSARDILARRPGRSTRTAGRPDSDRRRDGDGAQRALPLIMTCCPDKRAVNSKHGDQEGS